MKILRFWGYISPKFEKIAPEKLRINGRFSGVCYVKL